MLAGDESGAQRLSWGSREPEAAAKGAATTADDGSVQDWLNRAILTAYDVGADDARMRAQLLTESSLASEAAFAREFDVLRKNYPKRREFPCFQVGAMPEGLAEDKKKPLNKLLATLGFTLAIREES
nr:DUF3410 domain-containing protein [Aestuariicella hydrocarbonica]